MLDKTKNVDVTILINNDDDNFYIEMLNFQEFISQGGNLYICDNRKLMHNKFCVIDDRYLITESYNLDR
ncbi:MAG: phosphatidylserine/phosphatidylglycerophosphate/cardiolipin synthase family protein [Cytophagales bacterium]|nr:MAG: phosphatidylserine/phosphatidylglycerophosphate/cardiolipin synthase family protein [Cytophagales bacterium]